MSMPEIPRHSYETLEDQSGSTGPHSIGTIGPRGFSLGQRASSSGVISLAAFSVGQFGTQFLTRHVLGRGCVGVAANAVVTNDGTAGVRCV